MKSSYFTFSLRVFLNKGSLYEEIILSLHKCSLNFFFVEKIKLLFSELTFVPDKIQVAFPTLFQGS